jgi:hypothetical protein
VHLSDLESDSAQLDDIPFGEMVSVFINFGIFIEFNNMPKSVYRVLLIVIDSASVINPVVTLVSEEVQNWRRWVVVLVETILTV